jgi:hypothetical protein
VLLLGRMGIDRRCQNQGLGKGPLRDALLRALNTAEETGIFAMLAHPLMEQAYLSRGVVDSPLEPMSLMMTLATASSTGGVTSRSGSLRVLARSLGVSALP